jgi:hypothetical protein
MDRFTYNGSEPPVVAECRYCREDIRVGDEVCRIDDAGGFVHDNGTCSRRYAEERVYDRMGVIDAQGNVD